MNPFLTLRNVLDEYKRYIKTSYPILDEKLRNQFDKKIQEENLLWKGPYIQIPRQFKKGKSLKELERLEDNRIRKETLEKIHGTGKSLEELERLDTIRREKEKITLMNKEKEQMGKKMEDMRKYRNDYG